MNEAAFHVKACVNPAFIRSMKSVKDVFNLCKQNKKKIHFVQKREAKIKTKYENLLIQRYNEAEPEPTHIFTINISL